MYARGTVEKLLAQKAVAGLVLSERSASSLEELLFQYNELANLVLASETPAEAFSRYGHDQFQILIARTDDVYSLILDQSRNDLLTEPTPYVGSSY
jgi:hypothetical protein